jgi:tetratricopeptide (TPR) repeat protein
MRDQRIDIGDDLRFFLRHRRGPVIGFQLSELSTFEPDAAAHDLWADPRFRVPTLGLRRASIAEIGLRAKTSLLGRSTADVIADDRGHDLLRAHRFVDAERAFRDALDAGMLRAHIGVASALSGQGRYAEAYDHARIFTELAPRNSWAWAWLGRAALEVGALTEAQPALRRAVSLERRGSYATPAPRVLRSLDH